MLTLTLCTLRTFSRTDFSLNSNGRFSFKYNLVNGVKCLDDYGEFTQKFDLGLTEDSSLRNLKDIISHNTLPTSILESSPGQLIALYITSLLTLISLPPPFSILFTRPTSWTLKQTQLFKMILLRIPDINNIELLTEPLASSIAYNVVKNTLVIDIGAGTSDICLINFKSEIGEIKESKGINFAGNDIDLILEKEYGGGGWRKWKESMCGVNYWDDNTGEEFVDPVDSVDVGNRIVTLSEFRECIRVKVLPRYVIAHYGEKTIRIHAANA